jgi:DNA-binding HxlR family transcriptional regulator
MDSCSVFHVAHVVGKKWTIALLQQVELHGDSGFNFIANRMGITPKILSARLKELEHAGIVDSRASSYTLTDKGKELHALVKKIRDWNAKHGGFLGCAETECVTCACY